MKAVRAVRDRDIIHIKVWSQRGVGKEDRFYARCAGCDWKCHVKPHADEAVAERCMARHVLSAHNEALR